MASSQSPGVSAIRSLLALADKGDTFAQLVLADRYVRGNGVRQDRRTAAIWFDRAERTHDLLDFGKARPVLAKLMTPAQVAEAEGRAEEWVEIFKLLPRD